MIYFKYMTLIKEFPFISFKGYHVSMVMNIFLKEEARILRFHHTLVVSDSKTLETVDLRYIFVCNHRYTNPSYSFVISVNKNDRNKDVEKLVTKYKVNSHKNESGMMNHAKGLLLVLLLKQPRAQKLPTVAVEGIL